MKRFCIAIATVIVLALMAHGTAIAQSILSSISGTVTDPSGHVVPGAKVVAHETTTGVNRPEQSNSVGVYSLVDLLPGTYVVTVSKPGFKDEQSDVIILISAQSVKFDAPLQVGSATETIEVTSAPPTMNTENGELDEIVTGQDARRDAISRSIFALLATNPSSVSHGSTTMVGGQRAPYGNFTIDGVTTLNNIYGGTSGGMTADQAFESIAEIKVTDSNGAADTPGFGTVITTTKGGTNNYHGSAFYVTDNSYFNAAPFFSPVRTKSPLLQWYGGSVGGPVVIPKLYNGHNKTFFFVTWEHRTFPVSGGRPSFVPITLPSANFELGNFSQLLTGTSPLYISNPSTGVDYPSNTITGGTGPFTTLSSVAQAFQANYFPAPPSTFSFQDYAVLITAPEHINREDYKIDHHFSERSILSGRYTRQYDPEPDNYDSDTYILGHSKIATYNNTYVSHTYTFNQNLVNELRAAFAKDERDYEPFHNGAQVLAKTGLEGITVAPSVQGFPAIYFGSSDIEQMYENPSQTAVSYNYQVLDNINWQRGHHSIKAGVSITDTRPRSANGNGTQQLGTLDFSGFASGYDYADFLLGIPSSVSLNENPPNRYNRAINTGIYGQDTWTVSPKLSVTFGLRWDYYQPPVDSNDRRANFDPYYIGPTGLAGGIVLPDRKALTYLNPALPSVVTNDQIEVSPAGFPGRSMLYGNKLNFGPRLGVAYQIDPRTVIRAGWGIYYGILITSVQDNLAGGGVFGTSLSATNIITAGVPAFTLPNPFGSISTSTGNLACTSNCGLSETGVDPHIKTPTSQEYNLTIERDLGTC
jgi:outer membrane receptor protein involved in Fe transport